MRLRPLDGAKTVAGCVDVGVWQDRFAAPAGARIGPVTIGGRVLFARTHPV